MFSTAARSIHIISIFPERTAMPQALRILIVDDETANLDLLERALSRDGHQCIRAETGEEAVDAFGRETPDIVLMDVMLPGIDGFEATRRIRRQKTRRWVPIIFLSALNQAVDIVTGLDAGGDDYLPKPFDLSVLRSKILASQRFVELHQQIEVKSEQLQSYYDSSEEEKVLAAAMMRTLRRENRSPIPGVEFRTIAAIDVAGDIIAAEETPDGRLHLMLADATGHGLIAAINLLPAVEAFYSMTAKGYAMPRIIVHINNTLCELIPGHRFVSSLFACLDPIAGTVEVWNAGTPRALLATADGSLLHRFESRLVPLGIDLMKIGDLQSEIEAMGEGDVLVACSDGLIEAENAAGQPFGEQALISSLPDALADSGCNGILDQLRRHAGQSVFADDVSLCIVHQTPPPRIVKGRSVVAHEPQSCNPDNIGVSMVFGPAQLRSLRDVTPRFMNLARSHFDLAPAIYGRLYRVIRQLTANAVDWGLLRLPPPAANVSVNIRRQEREAALAALTEGRLRLSLQTCQTGDGKNIWSVTVEDSGPGFDGPAAIERAAAMQPRSGGLALVAGEVSSLMFDPPGNRVRAWIAD